MTFTSSLPGKPTSNLLAALLIALLTMAAAACGTTETSEPASEPTFQAVFDRVIAPSCTFGSCHASPTNAAALDLTAKSMCDALVNQPSCLFPDKMRVVPGAPEESFFFHKLSGEGMTETPTGDCGGTNTNLLMPYGAQQLAAADLALVHDWIAAGAQCESTGVVKPAPGAAIASLTMAEPAAVSGQMLTFTVALDGAAPAGGRTIRIGADSDALFAPVEITVPEGKESVRFFAYAGRPTARFALRARTGESMKELVLRIEGLEIVEVLADPTGDDDGLQWIKIHNRGALPVDLSTYRLRAGQTSYDFVSVALSGTLPEGGCAVIGAPLPHGADGNDELVSQVEKFSPNLPYGGEQAVGFALFDASAAPMGGVSTPVDTLLVGAMNDAELLGADGQVASPACGTPASGFSALRTATGTCEQAVAVPTSCR